MATIQIGVYIPGDSQLLDAACIDVLGIMSREYLLLLPDLPSHVAAAAPSVHISYITSKKNKEANAIKMTSNLVAVPTHDITDPEVQPGKLDIVFVPGPDPTTVFDHDAGEFLRKHAEIPTTDILSVCTGIYVCGHAGILKGRKACGPRALQADIARKFPGVELHGEKYRWIQDGNLWTSGGVTNGNDMLAAYARSGKHFPSAVAEIGCKMADVGDRPQLFDQSQTAFTIGFVWQLVRAWFVTSKQKAP